MHIPVISCSYIIGPIRNIFPNNALLPCRMLHKKLRVISKGEVVSASLIKHMLAAVNDCTNDTSIVVPFLQSFSVSFRHFP